MILLIDNYDSFSYNLYQLIGGINPDIKVVRNDVTLQEVKALMPSYIILSPGPGRPADAGICESAVRELNVPILGVCLGHQAICEAFGAEITYAKQLMHGKKSTAVLEAGSRLFEGLGESMEVARYHSLAAKEDTLPDCLWVTARTADGEIMAVEHTEKPIFGVQFHPESILTEQGRKIAENFLAVR
ncbi:MAG: aminodeoxychorismate/anthranilate synthase component II [Oscillospiraceae bacterium]|nr:aminodeoxychorismate/anthranilate synthase component II [Oscillospiraceae bacterium]